MTTKSVRAGEYAPPPADTPVITEICGTFPTASRSRGRSAVAAEGCDPIVHVGAA